MLVKRQFSHSSGLLGDRLLAKTATEEVSASVDAQKGSMSGSVAYRSNKMHFKGAVYSGSITP